MTLSMEVLPAPFGPMMARISPLRMSNETPVTAFTPPNDERDVLDRDSSASRPCAAARYSADSALPHAAAFTPPLSRGSAARRHADLQRSPNLDARREHAFAAVFERDLGRDVGFARAVVERLDQRGVAIGDEAASNLLRAGDFAVVGVELLRQDQEAPDLRAGHRLLLGQRAIHLVHVPRQHVVDSRLAGELLIGAVDDIVALGPIADRGKIDVDHAADEVALVAEHHRLADVGKELQLVLDVFRREQRAVVEAADVLGAVDDLELAGRGRRSRRRRS